MRVFMCCRRQETHGDPLAGALVVSMVKSGDGDEMVPVVMQPRGDRDRREKGMDVDELVQNFGQFATMGEGTFAPPPASPLPTERDGPSSSGAQSLGESGALSTTTLHPSAGEEESESPSAWFGAVSEKWHDRGGDGGGTTGGEAVGGGIHPLGGGPAVESPLFQGDYLPFSSGPHFLGGGEQREEEEVVVDTSFWAHGDSQDQAHNRFLMVWMSRENNLPRRMCCPLLEGFF